MIGTAEHIVTGLAEKLGYSIIPTWRLESRELAQHLGKVFKHYGITTVFDIGANIGQYHDFLRQQVGFFGQIHSFEPQPHLAETLRQRQGDDQAWVIHTTMMDGQSSYLKVDTQCFDLEILLGAPELLKTTKTLQFELAIQPLYADVPHYREMLDRVEKMGSRISGLFPISMDQGLRAVDFDCVLVCSD